jgi:hypothetical protein
MNGFVIDFKISDVLGASILLSQFQEFSKQKALTTTNHDNIIFQILKDKTYPNPFKWMIFPCSPSSSKSTRFQRKSLFNDTNQKHAKTMAIMGILTGKSKK